MFEDARHLAATGIFLALFPLAWALKIPKRVGLTFGGLLIASVGLLTIVYAVAGVPNSGFLLLVTILVALIVAAMNLAVRFARTKIRPVFMGTLALAAGGLALTLPSSAFLPLEWISVWLLVATVGYGELIYPSLLPVGTPDERERLKSAMMDASIETGEFALLCLTLI